MKVELVRAWPRRFERIELELGEGACVADALRLAEWGGATGTTAYAIFGVASNATTLLHDGDRIELLRPLSADPKETRRRRAISRKS